MIRGWRRVHYGMGDRKVVCVPCGRENYLYAGPGALRRQHEWMAWHLFHCRAARP